MPAPNKEAIREWVASLRSGTYQQTDGALWRRLTGGDDGYCCLGVACALFAEDLGLSRSYSYERNAGGYAPRGDEINFDAVLEEGVLPLRVAQFLGLSRDPSVYVKHPVTNTLSVLNDDYCWNFNQIADAIEATYLGEENNGE